MVINRQAWHYKLVQWIWASNTRGSANWLMGLGLATVPKWRRSWIALGDSSPVEPKSLCSYWWAILFAPLMVVEVFAFQVVGPIMGLLYWTCVLLWWPVDKVFLTMGRVVSQTPGKDVPASTTMLIRSGLKAVHERSCPLLKFVGEDGFHVEEQPAGIRGQDSKPTTLRYVLSGDSVAPDVLALVETARQRGCVLPHQVTAATFNLAIEFLVTHYPEEYRRED